MHLPSPVPRLCGSEPCDQGSNPGSGSAMGHVLALSNRKTTEVNSLEPLPPGAGGARWCQFPAALVPAVLATLLSYCSPATAVQQAEPSAVPGRPPGISRPQHCPPSSSSRSPGKAKATPIGGKYLELS